MKKILRFVEKLFFKLLMLSYPTFLIIAFVIITPIILVLFGLNGLKESFIDNKDLSYNSFKKVRKDVWCKS